MTRNVSNGIFLDVKPEPTEILCTAQSNYASPNIHNGIAFKNKPASPRNAATIKGENVDVVTMQIDATASNMNIQNDKSSSSNTNEEIKCNKNRAVVAKRPIKGCKNAKNYKCDICSRSFKTRYDVTRHTTLHSDERNHKCAICSKSFKTRMDVNQHVACHTNERNHKCNVCPKSFKTKSTLMDHVKRHTDERNHKCDVCAKSFKTRSTALGHMKRHTAERKHKCDVCPKSFKTRGNALEHMKCHTKERNHKCDVCGKGFKTRNNMQGHMKRHKDEKRPKTKGDVIVHRKRHSDEKHHKCGICGKSFKTKRYVIQHMRKHTEAYFDCYTCGMVFFHECVMNYKEKREGINAEGSRQKVPGDVLCDVGGEQEQSLVEEQKMNIKEENLEMEVPIDITESKPSMDIKQDYFLAAINEEKSKSRETLNFCHVHDSSVTEIKENFIGKHIGKRVINVKQEI